MDERRPDYDRPGRRRRTLPERARPRQGEQLKRPLSSTTCAWRRRILARRDTITVSGVGAAVATAATVGEILKSRSLATVTRVRTGTVTRVDERDPDERVGKATLELELRRSERFHHIRGGSRRERRRERRRRPRSHRGMNRPRAKHDAKEAWATTRA